MLILFFAVLIYFVSGWWLSVKQNKYAWIDFFWVSGFLLVTAWSVFQPFFASTLPRGLTPLITLAALYTLWSLRLGSMLFSRIRGETEDPRYDKLKKEWGSSTHKKFLLLFLFEGGLVLVLSLPMFLYVWYPMAELGTAHLLGVLLFALFLAGESLSDKQLRDFKRVNAGQKKVCDVGLWKYSRHPNYFFEIMIWVAYGIFCLPLGPVGWLGFLPATIMAFMIIKVTGIPYAEQQSIASRGDLYRDYQKRTSVLIPWFPKK